MMYYRKLLFSFALSCLFAGSLSAQVDFRILYQWMPGPGNQDTLKLFVQSTDSFPLTKTAVNFSIAYRSSCETVDSFYQIFTGLWGSFLEGKDEAQVLPVPKNYGGINYNRRIQYGNFGFVGITVPAVQAPPLCIGWVAFTRTCADFPYVEDESENGLNQWQGPLGPCTYEVIPIVVLPEIDFVFEGFVDDQGLARLSWYLSDPAYIRNMELYRDGDTQPIWTETPGRSKTYNYVEPMNSGANRYQLWLETVEGARFPSQKVLLNWSPSDFAVDVYPQPVRSSLTVRWNKGAPSHGALQLFDAQGRIVKSRQVEAEAQTATINLADFPSGSYVLRWVGSRRFAKPITIIR